MDHDYHEASSPGYAQLEESLRSWAISQPEILAVIVVGSRARQRHPADRWSDLDLVAFTTRLASRFTESNFPAFFGTPLLSLLQTIGSGDPEWLVVFENGLKLDLLFVVVPADPSSTGSLKEWIESSPYKFVFRRGIRILVDKSSPSIPDIHPGEPVSRPSQTGEADIDRAQQLFYLDCLRGAKYLRRGDLWRAQQVCDCVLKQHLLRWLEWRAQTGNQTIEDTWHDGRFLEEWADRESLIRLGQAFGGYDPVRLRAAYRISFDLTCATARHVYEQMQLPYPAERENRVRALFTEILDQP